MFQDRYGSVLVVLRVLVTKYVQVVVEVLHWLDLFNPERGLSHPTLT